MPLGDNDGDGIDDAVNASYADPDGDINDPQVNLFNQSGDTSEVGFREANAPPIIDLNSTAAETDIDRNYSGSFVEGGGSVSIVGVTADVEDADNPDLASMTITVGGVVDGSDETLFIAGTSVDLSQPLAAPLVTTVAGTTFNIAWDGTTFTITDNGGAGVPQADFDALIATLEYENTKRLPDESDRTFVFSVNDGVIESAVARSTINVQACLLYTSPSPRDS